MWENCGEEGYCGGNDSLVVARRFTQGFDTHVQIRLLAACARSCEEKVVYGTWKIMWKNGGKKPHSSLRMHIPFVTHQTQWKDPI